MTHTKIYLEIGKFIKIYPKIILHRENFPSKPQIFSCFVPFVLYLQIRIQLKRHSFLNFGCTQFHICFTSVIWRLRWACNCNFNNKYFDMCIHNDNICANLWKKSHTSRSDCGTCGFHFQCFGSHLDTFVPNVFWRASIHWQSLIEKENKNFLNHICFVRQFRVFGWTKNFTYFF